MKALSTDQLNVLEMLKGQCGRNLLDFRSWLGKQLFTSWGKDLSVCDGKPLMDLNWKKMLKSMLGREWIGRSKNENKHQDIAAGQAKRDGSWDQVARAKTESW